ncbi:hypothetical protein [Neoroseomonas marina]|uniref:hypothetical protein n=1 Tax=Neoroseomonas marina TaxID=1232220 RepID=UPI001B7D4D0E|nr:hypothetical protein [Neoroseomonas marina]
MLRRLRAGRRLAIFSAPVPLPTTPDLAEAEREGLSLALAPSVTGRASPRGPRPTTPAAPPVRTRSRTRRRRRRPAPAQPRPAPPPSPT